MMEEAAVEINEEVDLNLAASSRSREGFFRF
jgi:hypothetical protein